MQTEQLTRAGCAYDTSKIHSTEFELMQEKIQPRKRYIFASDFDQTLSFNDSGYV